METRNDDAVVDEYLLSSAEAILAGTLALMTAVAQGCCDGHRQSIREKVIANLAQLEKHEQLSQQFRVVASRLAQHWHALGAGQDLIVYRAWHAAPGAVQ